MGRNQGARGFSGDRVAPTALITMIVSLALGAGFWVALFALLVARNWPH